MAYSTGKIAVITGAASGIGRALALQLNREGCALHLADLDRAGLDQTAELLERPDAPASLRQLDVADRDAVHRWADEIRDATGRVDMLFNNAGVALIARVDESRYEDIEWLMNINFWGVVHGSMAFLPLLKAAPRGHLVNLSSVFGLVGIPTQSAYNAAKFAVRGYTEALRQEMDDSEVHVMCVHPGGIATDIARHSRGGDPGESPDERDRRFRSMTRTTAESAAAQIIRGVERGRKRLLIGKDARYLSLVSRLFPVRYPSFLPGLGEMAD